MIHGGIIALGFAFYWIVQHAIYLESLVHALGPVRILSLMSIIITCLVKVRLALKLQSPGVNAMAMAVYSAPAGLK